MAIVKAAAARNTITNVLNYVTRKEKTEAKLLTGIGCSPETAKNDMMVVKELWGKTGGRTYMHFVQSFHEGESITPEQAHRIACELVKKIPELKGYQVLIATHQDKKNIHSHFVVNSVRMEDGRKIQLTKSGLAAIKAESDRLCAEHGLSICEKGKTFDGSEREDTTAWKKETYQLLKKAEAGEAESYIQEIALAAMECRQQAVSRDDFCRRMADRGVRVEWSDTRTHVVFVDVDRELHGEKKRSVRNAWLEKHYHVDFGKEAMEHEFEVNARRKAEREAAARTARAASDAAEQLRDGASARAAEGRDSEALVREANAGIDRAEAARRDGQTDRADKGAEREQPESKPVAKPKRQRSSGRGAR